ncbi:MAG: hypothetical protein AAGA54_37005 [Myxococcota bacterium]
MIRRPGWAAALVLACACGDVPDPLWLLGDEPRVLAFRVEVVEPGPASEGLLPIPADRIRSQPLPGDTVEVSAWVADAVDEYATEDLDPAWFICPRDASCIESMQRPEAFESCEGPVPSRVACRIARGARPRFEIPPLDPALLLEEQAALRLAMVGHTDPDLDTERCIERISDPSGPDWTGCIVGYRIILLGPVARLVTHAVDEGFEPESFVPPDPAVPVIPTYNPEVTTLVLAPYYGRSPADTSRAVRVEPGGTATLEPGAVYVTESFFDPKDQQDFVIFAADGIPGFGPFSPSRMVYTASPDILEFSIRGGWRIWTPTEPATFSMLSVLFDPAGGIAWTTYHFEVAAP